MERFDPGWVKTARLGELMEARGVRNGRVLARGVVAVLADPTFWDKAPLERPISEAYLAALVDWLGDRDALAEMLEAAGLVEVVGGFMPARPSG